MNKSEYELLSDEDLQALVAADDVGAIIEWIRRREQSPGGRAGIEAAFERVATEDTVELILTRARDAAIEGDMNAIKLVLKVFLNDDRDTTAGKFPGMVTRVLSAGKMRELVHKIVELVNAGNRSAARQLRRLHRRLPNDAEPET